MGRHTRAAIALVGSTLLLTTAVAPAAAAAPPVPAHTQGVSPRPAIVAASITPVVTGAPASAAAVLANITMVDGSASGYVSADRCSRVGVGPRSSSVGNHGEGDAVANLAVVAVDPDGQFCLVNQSPVELLVDVQGWFSTAPGGQRFSPAPPSRRADTRETGRQPAGSITAVSTGLPTGTTAALVNLTMVGGSGSGYVTADRCTTLAPGPQARSNGNHPTGRAVSNLAVVPLDDDGRFCVYNHVSVDLVVDLLGSFAAPGPTSPQPAEPAGLGFRSNEPSRALDTRTGGRPAPGSLTRVATGLPAGTAAALVNLTMVGGEASGFITADRCSAMAPGPQRHSNGNHPPVAATANLAVVALDPDGSFCIANQVGVDVVVDVQGSFASDGETAFFQGSTARVLDTRPPAPSVPTTSCSSVVHIGDSTSVGMISPSYLPDPAQRIDAQYRRVGVTDPRMEISGARSIVETLAGQINARDTAAAIKAGGYEGCWVLALGTTDTANIAVGSGPGRRDRIDRMMAVIGDDPVLWVTVRTGVGGTDPWANTNMQLWNQALFAAAPVYPNLQIFDWAAVMNPAWFSSDRIHYTPAGYAERARAIADALAVAWSA